MRILSNEELVEMTGFRRPSAQVKALKDMGVPHRIRPDGRALVVDVDVPISSQEEIKDRVVLNI